MEIIDRLVALSKKGGLSEEQLFIDPLVTTISTGTGNAMITFETIQKTRLAYPDCHITSGLSNISFGMPHAAAHQSDLHGHVRSGGYG
jgi:5-methyltetrahydrofolate--homocysteine methyltransferase